MTRARAPGDRRLPRTGHASIGCGHTEAVTVIPSGGPLGATIHGVDLSRLLPEDTLEAVTRAWHEHLVLCFPGQTLTDEALIAWGRQFGELHTSHGLTYGGKPAGTAPEIELISTLPDDGVPPGARAAAECAWHTDMSFFETPASASILYAEIIPPESAGTRFANLYLAYEHLRDGLRDQVDGRLSLHDAAYTAMGEVRAGYEPVADRANGPGFRHPIVRTHPATGRRALFLGRRGYGYIEGLGVEASDRLLEALWSHMTQPAFVWTHTWQVGDVVMWDNRCTAHGRLALVAGARRRLRRVTVVGERPV